VPKKFQNVLFWTPGYLKLGMAAEVDLGPLGLVEEGGVGHSHAGHVGVLAIGLNPANHSSNIQSRDIAAA